MGSRQSARTELLQMVAVTQGRIVPDSDRLPDLAARTARQWSPDHTPERRTLTLVARISTSGGRAKAALQGASIGFQTVRAVPAAPRQVRLDGSGRALLVIEEPQLQDATGVALSLTDASGEEVHFPHVALNTSGTQRHRVGRWNLEVTAAAGLAPPRRRRPRARRLRVALSGTSAQLEKALPFFAQQPCIQLRSVLVDGRRAQLPGPRTRVHRLDASIRTRLDNVDVLVDLSDSRHVQTLVDRLRRGDGPAQLTVLRPGAELADRLELMRDLITRRNALGLGG